jgi:hypothetical protein
MKNGQGIKKRLLFKVLLGAGTEVLLLFVEEAQQKKGLRHVGRSPCNFVVASEGIELPFKHLHDASRFVTIVLTIQVVMCSFLS